jgi:hypothetical protein
MAEEFLFTNPILDKIEKALYSVLHKRMRGYLVLVDEEKREVSERLATQVSFSYRRKPTARVTTIWGSKQYCLEAKKRAYDVSAVFFSKPRNAVLSFYCLPRVNKGETVTVIPTYERA